MSDTTSSQLRARVDGKFFRIGDHKFFVKGVTYGPFAPDAHGETFPSQTQVRRDFTLIRELGCNLIRTYHVPPRWLMDMAVEFGLRILADIPWNAHLCFTERRKDQETARSTVRSAVAACNKHPAIFAFCVANEIPPDVARWCGAKAVTEFIENLVEVVKSADPEALCTFANFPPTEYLHPRNLDFVSFNVYLHNRRPFENYLARLQMIADTKPLLLSEFGLDSLREGEERKSQILAWQVEAAFRHGLAGTVVFSFTDDWWRSGQAVTDWTMGLTTRERMPKSSFESVKSVYRLAPFFPLPSLPKVSVVVACYNGSRTLKAALDSLQHLNYPNYEVILVDDGSTDDTPQIAASYKNIIYIRQMNKGLSVARNTGITASTGEVVAFTDADCRADEDWLYYLISDLLSSKYVGIGGHNFLPPDDSLVAAAVMASPGGPAHVMLTDRLAEHIPGCNMAFYTWALEEIGGFDPIFRKAGDDVDVCWRLQQRGYKIGFSPAAFVWHYRRSNMQAYLSQQHGYGEAEALLVRKHPEYFNALGGSLWAGRIYSSAKLGVVTKSRIIYHGVFGSGLFQTLYTAPPATFLMLMTSFEYHLFISIPLLILSVPFPVFLPVALTSVMIPVGVCIAAGVQAELPDTKRALWSKPLVALMYYLQPIVRGCARYKGRLTYTPTPVGAYEKLDSMVLRDSGQPLHEARYWTEQWVDRFDFIKTILDRLDKEGWQSKTDNGWSDYDVEVFGTRWSTLQLTTVAESHPQSKQLFRCRLKSAWSLPARVTLITAMAVDLLAIGLFRNVFPWIWFVLLSLPAMAWYFSQEQRNLQAMLMAFLDDTARARGMTKLNQSDPGPEQASQGNTSPYPHETVPRSRAISP